MALTNPIDPAAAVTMLLAQMDALGITVGDLTDTASGADAVTVAAYLAERVKPALTKGKRDVWDPYFALMTNGYAQLCGCMCPDCLDAFRGDSQWTPCRCVNAGHCSCPRVHLGAGAVGVSSCLEHCAGLGERPLAALRLADFEQLARWAQLRAEKRVAVRNRARGEAGRPTHSHDGRSAVEHFRAAASQMYRLALADEIAGVRKNHALDLALKPRPAPVARAYSVEQVEELWQAIFTSGGRDPELDMLIVWTVLETGARRGGPIGLTVGDLLFAANRVRLGEKNGKVDEQPVSAQLLATLLGHAIRRGGVVVRTTDGLHPLEVTVADVLAGRAVLRTDAPVLYYQGTRAVTRTEHRPDGTTVKVPVLDANGMPRFEPKPLTRKRFETLWGRLKRELVWLDEFHGRPHDLRKTMGTFVERAFGHAVAQRWLRHSVGDVTGTYTLAGAEEVDAAHAWIIGHTG